MEINKSTSVESGDGAPALAPPGAGKKARANSKPPGNAPRKKTGSTKAASISAGPPKRPVAPRETKIVADIDVGFGNALYIRGDGAGLTWEKGSPLACKDHRTWVWSTTSADDHFLFKLLLNDTQWAQGDNILISPGETVTVTPVFNQIP